MASKDAQPCTQPELVAALARGELPADQRRRVERLLEWSEPCRELFRQLTSGRFPSIPNYTILEQVGQGGFGVVYKAIHHAKQRTEALKVLFGRTPLLTSYFENEVRLISHLQHPHIATLYEAQLATTPPYYTMEFVEGERLNEYLRTHNVSLARRIEIIRTVALAIGYAHDRGVVHRDIKPISGSPSGSPGKKGLARRSRTGLHSRATPRRRWEPWASSHPSRSTGSRSTVGPISSPWERCSSSA
jgi:hypothetical protein